MKLVRPGPEHLASYTAALQQGWSADNVRGAVAAQEELERMPPRRRTSCAGWKTSRPGARW